MTIRKLVVIAVAAGVAAAAGAAFAGIAGAEGVIGSCYTKSTGAVRIVGSAAACGSGEMSLGWDRKVLLGGGAASFGAASPRAALQVDFDFNGDGFSDTSVGVPFEDVGKGPVVDGGAVQVVYGSAGGFSGVNQFVTENSPGVAGPAEQGDQFGWAAGIGDFNGDGLADLAVGVPGRTVKEAAGAGAIDVMYGSGDGLVGADQTFSEADAGVAPSAGDRFGAALASGDLNGDGFDDVVVGAPDADVGEVRDAGSVTVLFGSASGLTSEAAQYITENELGSGDGAESEDHFGQALAPYEADFNSDGFDDVAVGIPGEDIETRSDAGAVAVLYGSERGPDPLANQFWDQSPTDDPEQGDQFGWSLAAADVNGDTTDDLVVGAPGEDLGEGAGAGAVSIFRGSAETGLTGDGAQLVDQDTAGVAGSSQPGDSFGYDVATGDLDGDGIADLAVGVPGETVKGFPLAGAVNVLYGSDGGPNGARDQLWSQNSKDVRDVAEAGDRFGYTLDIEDFTGDGAADLGVGVPFEDVGTIVDAGASNELYGVAGTGLTALGNQFLNQNTKGMLDKSEPMDCWACDEFP
jgi:hypothetical protein